MKDKVIKLIEEEIANAHLAIKNGKYKNPLKEMQIEEMTPRKEDIGLQIIGYLEDYLLPEIKKLHE